MISRRLDLALPGEVEARVLFTGRGGSASGGSSRWPYASANLASHVGDDPVSVEANRHELARALGVPADSMTFMHPDHGRGVHMVSEPTGVRPGAEITAVDALVTTKSGIGLVALAADCVPVILVDPVAGVVAAVHCGWRGLVRDVVGAAVGAMERVGARGSDMAAYLGPSICGACYPVPQDRVDEVSVVRPEAVATAPDGQPALDVRVGLAARLAELEVSSELVGGCPAEDPALYSHRRDGLTGRQGGAVAIVAAT